jgi:hypothetical protein
MGRIIRLIAQDPQFIMSILTIVPYIITAVLTVMIASAIWTKKLSGDRGIILLGAILATIAFVGHNLLNYIILPNYGYEIYQDYIMAIQANHILGAIGNLLFSWGLYKYFVAKPRTSENQEDADPFIFRNH